MAHFILRPVLVVGRLGHYSLIKVIIRQLQQYARVMLTALGRLLLVVRCTVCDAASFDKVARLLFPVVLLYR